MIPNENNVLNLPLEMDIDGPFTGHQIFHHHTDQSKSFEGWYVNGLLHSENGPAVIRMDSDGTEEWYINGVLHREGGPAVEQYGYWSWYSFGLKHREDGPAVGYVDLCTLECIEEWWHEGKLHREDGPALISDDGRVEWWYKGEQYTAETHPRMKNLLAFK